MAQRILIASVIAVLIMFVEVSAKHGCKKFGHSCFGGHGKEGETDPESDSSEVMEGRRLGQAGTPLQPGYLRPHGVLDAGAGGGVYDRVGNSARDAMNPKLRNNLRYLTDY